MSDDLIARATESAGGFVIPDHWGGVVELEEGEGVFVGRFRGQDESSRGEPIYLFWDEQDEQRFFWSAYRLREGMEREQPSVGDTVVVVREANYSSRHDDPGEATGLAYGVAAEANDKPLPEAAAAVEAESSFDDSGIPF